jgi:hypothetical protein
MMGIENWFKEKNSKPKINHVKVALLSTGSLASAQRCKKSTEIVSVWPEQACLTKLQILPKIT